MIYITAWSISKSMSELKIESADTFVLPIIAAMHIDPDENNIKKIIFQNNGRYNFSLDKILMFYGIEPAGVIVAKKDNQTIGFIIVSKNLGRIKELFLKPRFFFLVHFALKFIFLQYGLNKELIKKVLLILYTNLIRKKVPSHGFVLNDLTKNRKENIPDYQIWAFIMMKSSRGKGIGFKLIEAACDYTRKCHSHSLGITVAKNNILALNLYQKAGFRIIGECLESTGPSYYLTKSLTNINMSQGNSSHNTLGMAVKKANRTVYNTKSVKQYDKNPSIFESSRQENIKSILNKISKKAGDDRFLDIGCGTGNIIKIGINYFRTVIGIDMADNLLKQVKQLQPEMNLIVADADYPPFKNNTFNCITLYGTMHHLFKPAETLLRISSLLKSGGILYTDHDPNYFFNRFYHLYYSLRYKHQHGFDSKEEDMAEFHHTRTAGINPELLKKVLLDNGFQDVQIYYRHTTNTSLKLPSRLVLYFLKIISRILPLRSLYTHFYLIAHLR
ncbi:MAG: GNAT family N-acetyltransferase [Planctomycetota bacterium]